MTLSSLLSMLRKLITKIVLLVVPLILDAAILAIREWLLSKKQLNQETKKIK